MSESLRVAFGMALLLLIGAGWASAQDDGFYHDPQGRFSFPLPAAWTDAGEGDYPHFVSAEGADLYVVVNAGDDLLAGIDAAVKGALPEVTGAPLRSNEVPLPGGVTWTQSLYLLDGGQSIVAGIGRIDAGTIIVIIVRGSQTALAAATPTLNAALLGFALEGEASPGSALPDYVNPDTYTEIEVAIQSGDFRLPGTLTLPNGVENAPAVVLVHGSGPHDRDETLGALKPFRDIALGLATRGIASLRYDKRTHVFRGSPEQLGDVTIDGEVTDDAVAAIALLAQTEGVDPARIYVAGHSLGGMLAPRIALHSGQAAGVILLAGNARPFGEVVADQIAYLETLGAPPGSTGLDAAVAGLAAIAAGTPPEEAFPESPAAAIYWGSLAAVDQRAEAASLALPFLVLQGERDYQVTMEDFALWRETLAGSPRARFASFPDLMHLFMALGDLSRMSVPSDYNESGFVAQDVIDAMAEWIGSQTEG